MKKGKFAGKRIEGILGVCLLFVFLTGCGEVQLQTGTNLQLEKDGSVTVTYIEEFPSDYYDVSELEAMNKEEVALYNQEKGENVVEVVSTETDGSQLTLVMRYEDMEDYGDMNGLQVYHGTVEQAKALGYNLDHSFKDVKAGSVVTDMDWEILAEHQVVIANEPAAIHTYKNIVYVTENVTVSDSKKMATITGEDIAVIVFK